jgi:hypothetical protein
MMETAKEVGKALLIVFVGIWLVNNIAILGKLTSRR